MSRRASSAFCACAIVFVLMAAMNGSTVDASQKAQGQGAELSQADRVSESGDSIQPSVPKSGNNTFVLLTVYSALIVAASLIGGAMPFLIRLSHTRMQTMISFVGGLMLGIGFLQLMPHAVHELHGAKPAAQWMMVGIVLMFVLLRLFHFHNHEPVVAEPVAKSECGHDHDSGHNAQSADTDETGKKHSAAECHQHGHAHGISWMGIAVGLSLHTLIDGIALGASVDAAAASTTFQLAGVGTFLAVLLHKPLDAVSITSLMMHEGWKPRTMKLVNLGFSLMCPVGAALFLLGVRRFAGYQQEILGTALAFSAGVFICISLSDLLPEMEFHSHNKVRLTLALALGIALAWGLSLVDAGHLH